MELPALILPGTHNEVIGIAVGYGHAERQAGKYGKLYRQAAVGAGKNAFPLMTYNGTTVDWFATGANFEDTKKIYKVAQMQTHTTL